MCLPQLCSNTLCAVFKIGFKGCHRILTKATFSPFSVLLIFLRKETVQGVRPAAVWPGRNPAQSETPLLGILPLLLPAEGTQWITNVRQFMHILLGGKSNSESMYLCITEAQKHNLICTRAVFRLHSINVFRAHLTPVAFIRPLIWDSAA